MFKKHALHVQMVKALQPPASSERPAEPHVTPEQISKLAKDQMQTVAILAGAAYTLKVALDTARDVALIAARAKFR